MDQGYTITRTQNSVYIDKGGKAVSGFTISVYLKAFDEELDIKVTSLDQAVVKAAIAKLVADRSALAALGNA